jgi:PASTA domain
MAHRLAALLPRFVLLAAGFALASAAVTFAAQKQIVSGKPAAAPTTAAPEPLLVPDVRGEAYVFAKGTLQDRGFAWRVTGPVQGFAANTVVDQQPAPGTRVVDTGAPLIVLRLIANSKYGQSGSPENASPYPGTPVRIPGATARKQHSVIESAAPKVAPKPASTPASKPSKRHSVRSRAEKAGAKQARPPAFAVPDAPREPPKEMPLPKRARLLLRWLEHHRKPTAAGRRHFEYQHAWVVTGARLGWWRGAEALTILLKGDRRAETLWRLGHYDERLARAALAEVRARSR